MLYWALRWHRPGRGWGLCELQIVASTAPPFLVLTTASRNTQASVTERPAPQASAPSTTSTLLRSADTTLPCDALPLTVLRRRLAAPSRVTGRRRAVPMLSVNDVVLGDKIGEGSTSQVVQGLCRGKPAAIKLLLGPRGNARAEREAAMFQVRAQAKVYARGMMSGMWAEENAEAAHVCGHLRSPEVTRGHLRSPEVTLCANSWHTSLSWCWAWALVPGYTAFKGYDTLQHHCA